MGAWQRELLASGWIASDWPIALGGLGLNAEAMEVVYDELIASAAPVPYNLVTVRMVYRTLRVHATDELQQRLIPRMARGLDGWCQLFSEPGAGSDLGSLAARVERHGDGWVLNGQKVWSSFASDAARGLLLARSDPSLAKTAGITAFALDLSAPGVTVRPLEQLTGDSDFFEVFCDEVCVSDNDRVGEINGGWDVARTMLSAERQLLGGSGASPVARVGGMDVETLVATVARRDPLTVDRLVSARVEETVVARLNGALGTRPELAPIAKLARSSANQRLQVLAVDLLGPAAVITDGAQLYSDAAFGMLRSRANSIGGGTSELMRTLAGEHLLGLPREPDPYRSRPWSEIPRS